MSGKTQKELFEQLVASAGSAFMLLETEETIAVSVKGTGKELLRLLAYALVKHPKLAELLETGLLLSKEMQED